MTENAITVPVRDINTISTEIKMIRDNVRKVALEGAIEIGRRLVEAKELVPFGEWGDWLKAEFDYSQPTASRLMTLFKEYSSDQQSLFGAEVKYSTLNNLSVSKALLLVAIPENEREGFAEEHHVEDMSTRKLEKLIKEKQAESDRADRAEQALKKRNEDSIAAHDMLEALREEHTALKAAAALTAKELENSEKTAAQALEAARAEAKTAAEKEMAEKLNAAKLKAREANDEKKRLESELSSAQADAERYKRDLEQIKDNPEIPQEIIDSIRKQFEEQISTAEARAAAAEAELTTVENKLKVATPEKQQFIFRSQMVQQNFAELLKIARGASPEESGKMLQAVDAILMQLHEIRSRGVTA